MNSSSEAIWSQYLDPQGRTYYYNSITKESTYTPPAHVQVDDSNDGGWREYKDKNNKSYYFNMVTKQCVWEEPEELRIRKAREEAKKMGLDVPLTSSTNNIQMATTSNGASTAPKTDVNEAGLKAKAFAHLSKKEAIVEFKKLLSDCNISAKIKWPEAMKVLQAEDRWHCMKSTGEKKQAFAEYQTQRAKQDKIEERTLRKKKRMEFMQLLAATEGILARTPYHEAKAWIEGDERFQAIDDDIERRDLY